MGFKGFIGFYGVKGGLKWFGRIYWVLVVLRILFVCCCLLLFRVFFGVGGFAGGFVIFKAVGGLGLLGV